MVPWMLSGPDVLAAHPDDGPLTPVTVRPNLSLLPPRLGLFHMQNNNKQKRVKRREQRTEHFHFLAPFHITSQKWSCQSVSDEHVTVSRVVLKYEVLTLGLSILTHTYSS